MDTGYATVIILFVINELTTIGIIVLLIRGKRIQAERADKLSAEMFEKYRRSYDK